MNKIKCFLCGRFFGQITSSHLKKDHDMTVLEYKKMFNNPKIITDETRKKISDNAKNNSSVGFKVGHKINSGKIPWNKGLSGVQKNKFKGRTKHNCSHLRIAGLKLSLRKRKHMWYSNCQVCKKEKSYNRSRMCVHCAAKYRARRYPSGMKGKKISDEHFKKLTSSQKLKPTKPEMEIQNFLDWFYTGFENEWRYVGNGKCWLVLKSGKRKNPDFINERNKKIIEVFGDYWHMGENPEDLIIEYGQIGYECLVLWESEIYNDLIIDDYEHFMGYKYYWEAS